MAAAPSPVEIGARGTIGALVSKEIAYFEMLNPGHHEPSSQKLDQVSTQVASTSGGSKQKSGSSREVKRRKKKKKSPASRGFLPSICSAVDAIDTSQSEKVTGISYRNLRTVG
ncbi:uncharacterized protein LOC121972601 [Zingiber officinale]|uniref:Uncharacterized protein n=1 Tax=Zingiber officinale TaxID=94328 RepID=A0A8J5GTL0_ZINOF|nr:uncharacterized protein LOC121972601 [Zingiber officinale]KAG6514822.1 hypothetical protein ZIOFF_025195 [Zingiber officinale]